MRRFAMLVALGLACALYGAPPLAAEEVTVGPWRILSGTSSAGGTYCTMQLGDVTKGVGLQLVSDGTVYLMVSNPDWQLTAKQSFPANYAIDGKAVWEGNAYAVTPNILVIGLPASSDPAAALSGGKTFLTSAAPSAPATTFDLSGAGAARDALKTCLASTPKPSAK